MIRFHSLPANEGAVDRIVKELRNAGYEGEEAQRIADAAASITLSILRGLDAKIDDASSDETDRSVIQQLVLHQLVSSSQRAMELNAIHGLFHILFDRRR